MDIKRSVTIAGHRTSIALETEFWDALKEIARARRIALSALIAEIDVTRLKRDETNGNLSRAIRLYVLAHFRGRAKS